MMTITSLRCCILLFFSPCLFAAMQVGSQTAPARQADIKITAGLFDADIDTKKSNLDALEIPKMNTFLTRVQERLNEVTAQGYGRALLLQPFHNSYRVYKFNVIDDQAVQGDIVLGELRDVIKRSLINQDAGLKDGDPATTIPEGTGLPPPLIADAVYRWPGGVVPYDIKEQGFSSSQLTLINNAISALNSKTNVTLRRRNNDDKDYVQIVANNKIDGAGMSPVGRQAGKQKLSLKANSKSKSKSKSTFTEKTVKHEMIHALGFQHEQTRSDRGKYIRIFWKNIIDGLEHNFQKDDARTYGDYNHASIMHYHSTAFGRDCQLLDYRKDQHCKNCEITEQQDFVKAKANGDPCSKITMRSKIDDVPISPSDTLTPDDIAAINAAYPADEQKPDGLPPITSYRTFTIKVTQIKRVAGNKGESGAVCGKYPDFIGEIVVGDVKEVNTGQNKKGLLLVNDTRLSKTKKKDKKVGDTVSPNWTLEVPLGPDDDELYVIVKVWEYDDAVCGGKNDLVDISPQKNQAYLRLLVNLSNGEIQHVRPQDIVGADKVVYYQRARYAGENIFDKEADKFEPVTFSGLGDKDATGYQMEASITLKMTII